MGPVPVVGAAAITADPGRRRLEELVFDAARAALDAAGLERADLDAVVLSGSDELDGRSISSMLTSMPAGGLLKDTVKITDSGLHALATSAMRILAKDTEIEIAVSWGLPSEGEPANVERTALDPFFERHTGVIDAVATGMMLGAYLADFDRNVGEIDDRAAAKWSAAGVAPDTLDRSFLAVPLRRSHVAPAVDAVAAAVVASPATVERRGLKVRGQITGIGWAVDAHSVGARERASQPALRLATQGALARAGNATSDLDAIEIEDRTVLHELLAVEAFGVAGPGQALDEFVNGAGEMVNRYTGDGFGGLPMHCSGLWRLARLCERDDVGRVAVQNSCGIAAQSHAVVVLEGARVT